MVGLDRLRARARIPSRACSTCGTSPRTRRDPRARRTSTRITSSGRLGALAAVAGLFQRERSGVGFHAEAAQFEGAIGFIGDWLARESLAPGSVHPRGNASERGAPWGAYPCAGEDEWCAISVRSDAEWQRLRLELGEPEWATDPALDTAEGRIARREAIDQGLSAWTSTREPREVMETLQAVGVPAGIVAHPAHHLSDPQLWHRGYPKLVVQPGYESLVLEGPPFLGSDLPEPIVGPAPWLGEHTREVAREVLGLSDGEIQALIDEGILEDPPKEFKRL